MQTTTSATLTSIFRRRLPDVTVVAIDTAAPALLRMAIEDTLGQIEPAAVVVMSDTDPAISGVRHVPISPMASLDDYAAHLWHDVPWLVGTSHFLVVQWDGWVLDGGRWDDRWLRYDYIGAVWPWFASARVGNGGFSLRSIRLARHIASGDFPPGPNEDELLCRRYRYALDRDGEFPWAPEDLANGFSFECAAPPPSGTFGFHDCRNFPNILTADRLRLRLDAASGYVRDKAQFQQLEMIYGQLK